MGANCSNQHHRGQHYKSGNSSQTPRLQETLRKQREPYQVTLTTTDKESQKTITDMRPYQINKRCQDIINTETDEKPKLNGISKITNGIRLQCKSPEDVHILRILNWNSAFEGLRIHKQKYGIVVHGVSIDEMEALTNGDTKHCLHARNKRRLIINSLCDRLKFPLRFSLG